MFAERDEFASVVRAFQGGPPIDEDVDRREIVWLIVLGALFVLSMAGFIFIVRR